MQKKGRSEREAEMERNVCHLGELMGAYSNENAIHKAINKCGVWGAGCVGCGLCGGAGERVIGASGHH